MSVLSGVILLAALLIAITAIYCLLRSRNLIRIIIAVEILMKAVTLLLVFAGYLANNVALTQAFVITMIVIEAVVAVVAVGLIINLQNKNNSLDARHLGYKQD